MVKPPRSPPVTRSEQSVSTPWPHWSAQQNTATVLLCIFSQNLPVICDHANCWYNVALFLLFPLILMQYFFCLSRTYQGATETKKYKYNGLWHLTAFSVQWHHASKTSSGVSLLNILFPLVKSVSGYGYSAVILTQANELTKVNRQFGEAELRWYLMWTERRPWWCPSFTTFLFANMLSWHTYATLACVRDGDSFWMETEVPTDSGSRCETFDYVRAMTELFSYFDILFQAAFSRPLVALGDSS